MEQKISVLRDWLGSGSINIFGKPFSGKDTQGERLAHIFNAPLIGGGDILRSHHDPAAIEKVMSEGGIIPSDFYLELMLPYFSQSEFTDHPFILSAVGRAHGEEAKILKTAKASGHPIRAAIYLEITDREVWQRYKASNKLHDRGDRADDQEDVLRNRLYKFKQKTLPVIKYYKSAGLLINVNGALERDEVTAKIIEKLYDFTTGRK